MKRIILTCIASLLGFYVNYAQCTFTGLNANYCVNSPASTLTSTLAGGIYSGPGISGNTFNPAAAGAGTHVITHYSATCNYSVTAGVFAPQPTVGTGVLLTDDATSAMLPIGFNFQFYCTTYTDFYICSNGFITFTGGQASPWLAVPFPTVTPHNLIAFPWTDLNSTLGGNMTYTTLGSAPNRTLLVSFNQVAHHNLGNGGFPVTVQTKLMETTNIIEIHTTSMPIPNNTYSATMGIQSVNGSSIAVVPGRNGISTWSATNDMYRFTPIAGCSSSQTTIVSPSTITVVGNNSVCIGTTSTLTATGNTSYTWSTTGGTLSNSASVTATPTITSTYSVSGTNGFGCIANSAITVTVDQTPTVTAVSTATGSGTCPTKTLALSGSGATGYSWTGGITNGVPFTAVVTTSYVVTGTNACGTSTAAITPSIHPLPPITAAASVPTLCSGISATLTGGGGVPGGYTWSNGVPNATSFSPAVTSGYTVVGTSAQGCTAQAVTGITVTPTPSLAPVISPTLICAGKSATVTATGATNYSWSTTQTTSSVVLSPVVTTTYSVTKWNSNCIDTKTFSVFVNQPPTVLTSANPTTICAQQTTTLDAYGGTGYTWTPYGGNLSQAIVSAAANIIFTVTVSDGTCVNTAQVPISVNPLPVISMVASSPSLCADQSVTLSVSGTDTYSWTNPTGLGTATTIVDTPAGNMSYQVTGTNTLTGCSSSTSAIVQVWARPTLTVAASKTLVCIGGPSTLTVKGAAHTFQWLHNAVTTTATIVNPLTTTVYSVTGTNTAYPCSSTSMITVSVFQPTFSVNSPTSSCAGGTIVLMASGANTYTWQTVPSQPFANIAVSPPGPTVYPVVATSILSGVTCTSSGQVNVSIYNNPAVTAAPSRTQICTKSETVELHASGAVSYTWNTQQTGSTVTTGPLTGQTVYTVTGTDQNGCMGTTTVMVKTSGCVGIGENEGMGQLLIYPNPSNGAFVISSPADMSLIMVNELGQLVRTIELNAMNNREVSVTDLAGGMYFITSKEGDMVKQKIIVTR